MKFVKKIGFIIIFFSAKTLLAQYITVNDTYTPQQLASSVLNSNQCANITNVSAVSGNFNSTQKSYGYFSAGTSTFPFANGVVLSTCRAASCEGPNNSILSEDATSWLGDTDLESALGISTTSDATILEFDFQPLLNYFSFDYIFASEEYHGTAPCSYSDGFAFLLKQVGSTTPYQNLAVLPGTTTPVKVTTVHPDIPGGCGAQNPTYFAGYNAAAAAINFNGQTTVLTAKANVIPGNTYHIKLVIADQGNPQYDSAIFLGGGSFNVGVDLGVDRLLATNNPICAGETFTLHANVIAGATYKWFKNSIDTGITTTDYTVSSSGIYTVQITLNATCIATGKITIDYTTLPVLANTAIVQCDDNSDGITTFNLTSVNSIVTISNASLNIPVYYPTLPDAQNQTYAITTPTAYQSSAKNVYARVTNQYGCVNYATISLQIANNIIISQPPIIVCDLVEPQDGFTSFSAADIAPTTTSILSGLPTGLIVTYYASANDAIANINAIAFPFTNTIANQQTIYAKILNGTDCYGLIPIVLKINTFDPANFQDQNEYLCSTNAINLSVASGFSIYLWTNGATSNSISIATAGTYSVTVTNSNGCTRTKKFIVSATTPTIITSIDINDFDGSDNSVVVNVSGSGIYTYSLDGIHFQSSSLFTNVFPNVYTTYVNDSSGCGNLTQEILVMDYPRFFSPNSDGINDFWYIKNLVYQPNAVVSIFDRFGQLLYSFKANHLGWNGTFNQRELPADDYWFTITFENGRIVKRHFSLVR